MLIYRWLVLLLQAIPSACDGTYTGRATAQGTRRQPDITGEPLSVSAAEASSIHKFMGDGCTPC